MMRLDRENMPLIENKWRENVSDRICGQKCMGNKTGNPKSCCEGSRLILVYLKRDPARGDLWPWYTLTKQSLLPGPSSVAQLLNNMFLRAKRPVMTNNGERWEIKREWARLISHDCSCPPSLLIFSSVSLHPSAVPVVCPGYDWPGCYERAKHSHRMVPLSCQVQ